MKKLMSCLLITIMVVSVSSLLAAAQELPESVKSQARKDAKESAVWQKFDKSGAVKFLQVEDTAAASEPGKAAGIGRFCWRTAD